MALIHASILTMAAAPALLAVLSLGGAFSRRLDVLTHFAPLYEIAGLFAAGVALAAGPPDRLALAAALVSILVTAGLMGPELAGRMSQGRAEAKRPTRKVIQLNLWYANKDPAGTARWIEAERPDILVVEEACAPPRPLSMRWR